MIHMGSDHRCVMAQFEVIPAPIKKDSLLAKTDSKNGFQKKTHRLTESIRIPTSEEVKCEETTRFEERYREFERKIMQEEDTTTAACKHTEDEPAAISEHGDGLNETTATADKRKLKQQTKNIPKNCDEATAAEDKGRNEAQQQQQQR